MKSTTRQRNNPNALQLSSSPPHLRDKHHKQELQVTMQDEIVLFLSLTLD